MGCGQSKIGKIYSKNKKNKNHSRKSSNNIRSNPVDQKNGNNKSAKTNNNECEVNRNEIENNQFDIRNQAKKKTNGSGTGPLFQQTEVSSSQLDFFKMLDEKIESGPDYDESLDTALNHDRVTDLLEQWELASVIWASSSTNLSESVLSDSIPKKMGLKKLERMKDRDVMQSIVSGRQETTPIYFKNSNNRIDGLEDVRLSPKMPKHILESISQSPTSSLKYNSPPNNISMGSINFIPNSKLIQSNLQSFQFNSNSNDHIIDQEAMFRDEYLQQTGIINQSNLFNHQFNSNNSNQRSFNTQIT